MTDKRTPEDRSDDLELDAFVAEAAGTLEREIGSRAVPRDFGVVLVRARALDPQQVPAGTDHGVQSSGQVIELRPHRESAEIAVRERALDALISDARTALDTKITEDRPAATQLPAATAQAPFTTQRSRLGRVAAVGAGLAVAAAIVLAAVNVTTSARRSTGEDLKHQAPMAELDRAVEQSLERRPTHRAPAEPTTVVDPTLPPPTEELVTIPQPKPVRRSPVATPTLHDRLVALDARAQAQWRAGSLDLAEQTFRVLIRLAKTDRYAELAYADLFSIAHRKGDPTSQGKLWREYLGQFPKGRYADDARAGLCRRASGDAQRGCWTAYLRELPRGSYRAEAARIVGSGGPAKP